VAAADGPGVPAGERGRALYVRGHALSLTECSAEAEDCLTRAVRRLPVLRLTPVLHAPRPACPPSAPLSCRLARSCTQVKLNPSLVSAWNALGFVFWRRSQLTHARAAFAAAQSRSPNAASLRHLSGVTRGLAQAAGAPAERQALAAESVAHAKAALQCDVADGASWYNLAMAQLAHAFAAGGGAAEALAAVLKAFAQAERCGEAARNPDLHFNRGVTLRYLEELQGAADCFARAGQLDDSLPWRQQLRALLEDAARTHDLVAAQGRQKPKRVAAAAAAAAAAPPLPGLAPATLATLAAGANAGAALACRVLATASLRGAVPVVHIAVDAAGECFALSLYGLREGALREGVPIAVLAPRLAHARLAAPDRALAFPLVRVDGAGGVLCGGSHPVAHAEPPRLSARCP
jgi:tetratricopeptide (TPR) repeat protein